MAHQVNPSGYRPGKTFLWNNNAFSNVGNKQLNVVEGINQAQGLEATASYIMQRSNFLAVKSAARFDPNSNVIKLNVLYYPLVAPMLRKRLFPTYCTPRALLSKPSHYNASLKGLIAKVWASKNREFNDRFVRGKVYKNLNKTITKAMFRGAKLFVGNKKLFVKSSKFGIDTKWAETSKYMKRRNINYLVTKNRWSRWRVSKKRFSSQRLSKQLSKRVGCRVQVKAMNVFNYIAKKTKKLSFKKHQRHVWNKRYHYNKKRFTSYYDIVNSLYLLCYVSGSENLVMKMIQYGLTNMHRRKIRPKNFFYFLDSVVKNMKSVKKNFNAFRLIITGKLRGGTSRTKSFSTGFGVMPRQTLDKNIRYEFGDVRSKYGSFGVKLLAWRKSEHEMLTDSRVKWALKYRRRSYQIKVVTPKKLKLTRSVVGKKFYKHQKTKLVRRKLSRKLLSKSKRMLK